MDFWSKASLTPLLYDTKVLRELFNWSNNHPDNSKRIKKFRGGSISLVGSNSPSGLRGKTIRIVLADETDVFAESTGQEGDPLALAEIRATTFQHRKKIILASTPGLKDFSIIEGEFEKSDKRYYHVPCPECNHHQPLQWKVADNQYGLHFADDPENPVYVCQGCGYGIPESKKTRMLAQGKWVATADSEVAGFHLNALYSPFQKWSELVAEWKKTKNNKRKLQVFVNTRLAQTWDDSTERTSTNQLAQRVESYNAPVPTYEEDICNGVGVLTGGVDVQQNRIEMMVLGSGDSDELWIVDYAIFEGDTSQDHVWNQLQDFILHAKYSLKNGVTIRLKSVCVDSGFATDRVYRFVAHMSSIQKKTLVFAIKGVQTHSRVIDDLPLQSKKYAQSFRRIGTDMTKDHLSGIMANSVAGPNCLHIPIAFPMPVGEKALATGEQRWVSREFLDQLTSERPMVVNKNNRRTRQWVLPSGKRNEAWDCLIYSYAAMRVLGLAFLNNLGNRAKELSGAHIAPDEPDEAPESDVSEKIEENKVILRPKRQKDIVFHKSTSNSNFWRR